MRPLIQNLNIALISFFLVYSSIVKAENLIFAGFSFSGEADSISVRYPYLSELYKQKMPNGVSNLTAQVMARLGQVNNPNLPILPPDTLMNLRNMESSLVSVLLLTGETVLIENYSSYYKTFINLSADALIFDYKNKTIIRSYPLNVVLFDASLGNQPPNNQNIQKLITNMISRNDDKGLISQYLSRLSLATLPKYGAGKSIQVNKVEISPEAFSMFPSQLRMKPNAMSDILSDGFSSALSAKTGVSILPSKIGHAYGLMTLKLENSDDQIKIKIGDGDYLVNLKLNKYAKIKKEETAVEVSNIFATSVNIDLYEEVSGQHFLQSDFKNGELSITPINRQTGDDFPGFMDSLSGVFKKFGEAIRTNDLSWVKVSSSNPNIANEISKTRKMIESNM